MDEDFFDEEARLRASEARAPKTLEEMLNRVIESGGWGRYLEAKQVGSSQLWQVVSIPPAGEYRGSDDILMTVSEKDFQTGTVTSNEVRAECRRYILSRY